MGILLLVTLVAFENMGVNTAMPKLVADLHGESLYSWPFVAFLAASVIATVLSGRVSDRRGPVPSLLVGPALFFVGLIVAGTAQSMTMLLAGRVLQGLGAGAQVVAIYVLIALVYPQRDRPAVFGALSGAWVLPSLIGPALSGVITENLSWRVVFLGLAPLVLLGLLLLVPVLRRLPAHVAGDTVVRRGLTLAAIAAGVGVAGLSWAAEHPSLPSLALGVAAIAVLAPALRTLLPTGTLLARRGLPVTILARALLAGTYFGVSAYLPLTLVAVHGYSIALAGVPLTVGALGWSSASAWQARHPDLARSTLLRWGFVLLAVGTAGLTLVAPSWSSPWLALPFSVIAGAGMGLGTSSVSVLTLAGSSAADRGFNSAAMQIADMLGSAIMIGLGGALVSALASTRLPTAAIVPFDLLMAALAVLGAVLTGPRARVDSVA
ncbi:MFS transporter [Solihabitans fulvus]|uniref:MFS transporter n=2 Tax=Solihabitans fulvus TaxID=1892852 RepID=A0A5B2X849_9PSEU|nr:MFS transporter [Solihabitans fulvus]